MYWLSPRLPVTRPSSIPNVLTSQLLQNKRVDCELQEVTGQRTNIAITINKDRANGSPLRPTSSQKTTGWRGCRGSTRTPGDSYGCTTEYPDALHYCLLCQLLSSVRFWWKLLITSPEQGCHPLRTFTPCGGIIGDSSHLGHKLLCLLQVWQTVLKHLVPPQQAHGQIHPAGHNPHCHCTASPCTCVLHYLMLTTC